MAHRARPWIWLALPVAIGLLTIPGYQLAKDIRFDTDAPKGNFPPPSSVAEARAQDVEHLGLFFEYERSWTPATLAEARKRYDELNHDAAGMSDAAFDLGVAHVVAAADNGHTKIREYHRTPRYNRLPVRGHGFDDGYYLIRAYEGYEELLGQRLVAIDGHSMDEVRSTLRRYVGGTDEVFDKYLPYLMESPQLLHAAGLSASPESVSLTLVKEAGTDGVGETETVTMDAPYPASSEQIARSYLLLAPQVYSESQPDWKTYHQPDAALPLYLQAPFQQFQFVQQKDSPISYLQFWSNNDSGDTSIKKFCKDSLTRYQRNPTEVLIIDQRFNGGGNSDKTADCMRAFGRSVPADGRLYVVVGGPTFSAGIVSAALAMVAAGDRAVLIGTHVGDRMSWWSEDNLLKLPNSGIEIKFTTGKHDLVNGCKDWRQCYWGNKFSDLRVNSMEPDMVVPLTFDDYRNHRDPVMAAIRDHRRTSRNKDA